MNHSNAGGPTAREKRRAKLPPAPPRPDTTAHNELAMALNVKNKLVLKIPAVSFLYQIDVDSSDATDEEIIFEHNDTQWEQRLSLAALEVFDHDWVELVFYYPPESGTFNLLQDPKDGDDPYFVFEDIPYENLNHILCDIAEPTQLHPEDDGDEEESPSATGDSAHSGAGTARSQDA